MKRLNKYLCSIDKPDFQPGPFSVRLKYELKNQFFNQKKSYLFPVLNYSFMSLLLLIIGLLVVRPQTALKINQLAFNKQDNLDFLLLNPDAESLNNNYNDNLQTVSATNSPFSMIEEDKSYIVHKLKDETNRTVIYISEVKKKVEPRVLY